MTIRHLCLALLLLGLTATPALAARHALLIGIGDYQHAGLADLPGARTDLDLTERVLRERLGFGDADITRLLDAEATHVGIQQAFESLADRVRDGDFVYIHYSGHGSLVADQGDEQERSGYDQTLVSHGARSDASDGLNRYDVLDDELSAWLAPIADKAGELVVVSDACHSATNTRGQAPVARAAPAAAQADHPLASARLARADLSRAVVIGAARDDQSAHEIQIDDGLAADAFSVHWAAALERAAPGDSWRQVFARAALWTRQTGGFVQDPQLSGHGAERAINGGDVVVRQFRGQFTQLRNSGDSLLNCGWHHAELSKLSPELPTSCNSSGPVRRLKKPLASALSRWFEMGWRCRAGAVGLRCMVGRLRVGWV